MPYKRINDTLITNEDNLSIPTDPLNRHYTEYFMENLPIGPEMVEFITKELKLVIGACYAEKSSSYDIGKKIVEFGKMLKWGGLY